MGVAALGPAPILLDDALAPLTPALLFSLDRRAEEQRSRLDLTHDHALPKLAWWSEREPARWARAAWAVDATGYLVAQLTGHAVMDWITRSDYLLAQDGGDERAVLSGPCALPAAASAADIAGGLVSSAAARLGLPSGVPVTVGTYDTFADLLATGVRAPGDAGLLLGSTLVVGVAIPSPIACAGLETGGYLGDGILLGGWTASAGSTLEWVARELGGLQEAAALRPGDGGLIALPYLAGERTPVWDPDARGALVGMSLTTRRAQIARAFVDGVALSARDHVERLRPLGLDPQGWRVGGGGARAAGWAQATADALDAPLEVVRHAGEAIGGAALALRALGAELELSTETLIEPDPASVARYDALYAVYRTLHPALADAMERLTRLDEVGR